VIAIAVASAGVAGCQHDGADSARHSQTPSAESRADREAVRIAIGSSGILTPFRPARLGTRSCRIARGGPVTQLLHGTCRARVRRRHADRVVLLTESWNKRDFAGSGERFRNPSGARSKTTWTFVVARSGHVRRVTISGNFPPQLVM
jgi:hypothetical protein